MNCASFKKMIYLYGENELSGKEKSGLMVHLDECKACSEEFERASSLKIKTANLSELMPVFDEEERFTDELMKEIYQIRNNVKEDLFFDKILLMLSGNRIRLGLVSFLVMVCISFLYETTVVVSGISELENNVDNFSKIEMNKASVDINPDFTGTLTELYKLYNDKQEFASLSSEWILIKKDSFRRLMHVYSKVHDLSWKIPSGFEKDYPELYNFIRENAETKTPIVEQINVKVLKELERILEKGEYRNAKD